MHRPHPGFQGEYRLQQGFRFVEERPVVADVVDHRQGLVDTRRLPETATKLLQPEDFRFGRAQHEDGVDVGQVDAFVEHVDGEDDVELAAAETVK